MGFLFSKLWLFDYIWKKVNITNVLLIGLDNAGKTTIFNQWMYGNENIATIPTIGFNVNCIKYNRKIFQIWDLGGHKNARHYWKPHHNNVDVIVFVVDGTDRYRLKEAKQELFNIFCDKDNECVIINKPIIIVANKQDLVKIKTINQEKKIVNNKWNQNENEVVKWDEIKFHYLEIDKLSNYSEDRVAFISTSGLYGTGVWEIFQWIIDHGYAK